MKLRTHFKTLTWLLVFLTPVIAHAHTALKESTPANGVTINAAPGHIDLVFNAPVRLIKLDLKAADHICPTNFQVQSESIASYRFETEDMHEGEFTVEWAAIGADGHTVTNSFGFVVDPTAAPSGN